MIEFTSLKKNYDLYANEYEEASIQAIRSGWYILGPKLERFEREFAEYLGVKHVIGVNSGTDALILGIRALGIGKGDEVIVPAGTYIASALGITENSATPIFVDLDKDTYLIDTDKIEQAITPHTKAILPVHLYGQTCNMERILDIATKHKLSILEDCAQCHGSQWNGKLSGTQGTLAAFSFYPTKPLGAMGDAGAIATNDDELDDKVRMLRNYGSRIKYENESNGRNSRMDEIHAAILSVGLRHLDELNSMRIRIAERYHREINNAKLKLPYIDAAATHVYHLFPVMADNQKRFQNYMKKCGIKTQVHYPIPPYVAKCYSHYGYEWEDFPVASYLSKHEVSLPIYSGMSDSDVTSVIDAVNNYGLGVKSNYLG